MSDWITLPSPPLLQPSAPLLIRSGDLDSLRGFLAGRDAEIVEIDFSDAASTVDVIGVLKNALPFPSWCGSSWDAIDDAFNEIRDSWSFPLVVIAHGLLSMLSVQPHLALASVVRLHELSGAFSAAGDQFVVVFAAETWP